MSLETYVSRLARLHVGRIGGHERPHKPVMLLALLDLFEQELVKGNQITYSPDLLELFHEYFKAVSSGTDKPTPLNPFFYLRSDGFWHHHPRLGQQSLLRTLRNPPGMRAFQEISDYVYLDDDLFALLQDDAVRKVLRQTLITRYFGNIGDAVVRVASREKEVSRYQEKIEEGARGKEGVDEAVRSTAFSRLVRRAYDYRCAACGLRVIMEGGLYIVDAAYIVPFCETRDDDPRNGMALCKNHHSAMDWGLIAPGADSVCHVSDTLDDRLEGQRDLISLDRRSILLPTGLRYHPKESSLHWREKRLMK